MKKLILTAVFALIGTWAFAQTSIPEGLMYEVVNGKTVTITGYEGNDATLSIPEYIQGLHVTAIGRLAFEYRSGIFATDGGDIMIAGDSLTSITIASSVSSIGDRAFYDCRKLTSISITRRTKVGENTFPLSTQITYSDADTIPIQEVHGWGSSPTLSGLSNRWAGPDYAQKIIAILGKMYQ